MMQAKDTERIKFNDRDYSCTCYQCGVTFEATRSDASFCSAKCRVEHSREPQKLENAIRELEAMAARINELGRKYPINTRIFEAMGKVQGAVSDRRSSQENK